MSQFVTVSISGAAISETAPATMPEAVSKVRDFWTKELEPFRCEHPDLILLPECCDRFRNQSLQQYKDFCAQRNDATHQFFQEWASKQHCLLAYCANRFDSQGKYINAMRLIGRDGDLLAEYRKHFPTPWELEDANVQPGNDIPVISCELGRIGCAICFDLNFDSLFQTYSERKIDLLLFSSVFHGGWLQRTRAAMLQCFFLGAVSGERCSIWDPQGELVAESSNYIPRMTTQLNLDCRVVHYDGNFEKLDAL
ncbi:MAG: carbon-nitrogen hydrolase family protein, partial [Victivallales bacterium]|nr:carbon-nitrogen hydrolase family protein [Victivallales bacterium]